MTLSQEQFNELILQIGGTRMGLADWLAESILKGSERHSCRVLLMSRIMNSLTNSAALRRVGGRTFRSDNSGCPAKNFSALKLQGLKPA